MEPGAASRRTSRFSSYERLVAIGLALLAVLSPLYIDRTTVDDSELDLEQPINFASWLPLLLLVLILALTCRFTWTEALPGLILTGFTELAVLLVA
ncbi:uncharacterized protein Pyn_27482 [Prunus yedoensis var. nudiflora]|uniref:Uncharacterized protein n=1 Tax=Prunus yedoensis var. nudiflora TaxID=2094558 RepID=A0A314XZ38_PRUYE|nr:uncharacterized protein Pyn_27482 [Prunus yedoensis var. nudiflora]